MAEHILTSSTWQPDLEDFMHEHHLREQDREMTALLIEETRSLSGPLGGFCAVSPAHCSKDTVHLNGSTLHSKLLCRHLSTQELVFPFVTTCGPELSSWVDSKTDLMDNYLAHALAEKATHQITEDLRLTLEDQYQVRDLSRMQPGSLPDWPLQEQQPLFQILGSIPDSVQVRLTSSSLMLPTLSLSGIFFQDPEGFISCQLCSRTTCPRRKAPFDPERLARLQEE